MIKIKFNATHQYYGGNILSNFFQYYHIIYFLNYILGILIKNAKLRCMKKMYVAYLNTFA